MKVTVTSLDQEARGIARLDGKVVFVQGGLPSECLEIKPEKKQKKYDIASIKRILKPSVYRKEPLCEYHKYCGGCSLQHVDHFTQVALKQRILEDTLLYIGGLKGFHILPPVSGPAFGYRHRARLSVRWVSGKDSILVGFREKQSRFIVDMKKCPVLPSRVSNLLLPLRQLIGSLSVYQQVPQIEVALDDNQKLVLVLRSLTNLSEDDEMKLMDFAQEHHLVWQVQPKTPKLLYTLPSAGESKLNYHLKDFGICFQFSASHFTQVNPLQNDILVRRALSYLDPKPKEEIADMFCGLGNFSLPIAKKGAFIKGFECQQELISLAESNADRNGLSSLSEFQVADLMSAKHLKKHQWGNEFDKMLIDPPRSGAFDLVKSLNGDRLRRIVYVSCNASTLARDAAMLVNEKGYELISAGIINMFPQTTHIESITLFEKRNVYKKATLRKL